MYSCLIATIFFFVYYHIKIPLVKWAKGLSAEQLIRCCNIISAECGLPHKIISEAVTSFVSDNSKNSTENWT